MIVRRGASSFVACGINVCQGWLSLDTRSLVEWRWRVEGRRRGETRTEGRNDVNPEENLAGGIGNGTRWRCICRSTSDTIEFWFHPSLYLSISLSLPGCSDNFRLSVDVINPPIFLGNFVSTACTAPWTRLGTGGWRGGEIDSRLSLEENEPRAARNETPYGNVDSAPTVIILGVMRSS